MSRLKPMKLHVLMYKNKDSESDPEGCVVGIFESVAVARRAMTKIKNSYKLYSRYGEGGWWIWTINLNQIEMYYHCNDSPDAEKDCEDACVFELERIRNKEEKWEPLK